MAWSRFVDGIFKKACTAHLCTSVAWSYPVTPLAVFALGCRFDSWDAINAINAPNLGSACPDAVGPAGRWLWPRVRPVPSPSSCEHACCWRGWR